MRRIVSCVLAVVLLLPGVALAHEPHSAYKNAIICLALNTYHEARSEPWAGQVAVAQVALRRAGYQFNRVCNEIWKDNQFSWTIDYPKNSDLPVGNAWQWALVAADEAIQWSLYQDDYMDYSNGADHYHATYIKAPKWTKRMTLTKVIGNHIFYSRTRLQFIL
jgi:spore germination cell wall hydrolase CwlJ-like protein